LRKTWKKLSDKLEITNLTIFIRLTGFRFRFGNVHFESQSFSQRKRRLKKAHDSAHCFLKAVRVNEGRRDKKFSKAYFPLFQQIVSALRSETEENDRRNSLATGANLLTWVTGLSRSTENGSFYGFCGVLPQFYKREDSTRFPGLVWLMSAWVTYVCCGAGACR
jgi:hypothetical protein